jgi:hypothetical protein
MPCEFNSVFWVYLCTWMTSSRLAKYSDIPSVVVCRLPVPVVLLA